MIAVTEMMLVRTRAEQVAANWQSFFTKYPTLEILASAPKEQVEACLQPLGLRWRAKTIESFAKVADSTPEWHLKEGSAPGYGPYVAAATQVAQSGRGLLPLDVTIARVLARYYGVSTRGEARRDARILARVRDLGPRSPAFFFSLLDLAATLCRPREAFCRHCPLGTRCRSARLS